MDTALGKCQQLFGAKTKELWEDLGDEVKWAKYATELRLQLEFLEVKQDRLFREYGKRVFLSGRCDGANTEALRREIQLIEAELQKKFLALQKLSAPS